MTPTPETLRKAAEEVMGGTLYDELIAAVAAWQKDLDNWKEDDDTLHAIGEDLDALSKQLAASEQARSAAVKMLLEEREARVASEQARQMLEDALAQVTPRELWPAALAQTKP